MTSERGRALARATQNGLLPLDERAPVTVTKPSSALVRRAIKEREAWTLE